MAKKKERRWSAPNKRAKGYASELKGKKHFWGPKQNQPLTHFEAGLRSGYLQAQTDSACLYKYKKALAEGKTKEEAVAISKAWPQKRRAAAAPKEQTQPKERKKRASKAKKDAPQQIGIFTN